MKAFLVHQGLEDVLGGMSTLPEKHNDKGKKELLSMAHNTIILSLGGDVLTEVADQRTPTGVWLKLESLYMTKSLTNKLYLGKKLHQFKLEEGS